MAAKPSTDDIRKPTVVELINRIASLGIKMHAYNLGIDIQQNKVNTPNVKVFTPVYSTVVDIDYIILLTNWPKFKQLNQYLIRELVSPDYTVVIDPRNCLNQVVIKPIRFTYEYL